ncbi:MAG: hypothetical protein LPK07_05095 [Hymenobacteraceae bacterium]|nr:hypothetical protein [Hymenobacteraceae bacterium]MDX5481039.1 hypothetical protein [Hymenobacteraceae bacterium]
MFLLCLLLALPLYLSAQAPADSLPREKRWFVPDGAVVQHAGNMGYVAIGPSYDLGQEKLLLDVLYGYVPRFEAEEELHLITLKPVYQPQKVALGDKYSLTPLRIGLGLSYYFGDQFSIRWDDSYPDGYYWWPTSLRLLGYAGAAVSRKFEAAKAIQEVSLYSELGTYDLIVTQWVKDSHLSAWDIINVSVGVRVAF